MVLPWILSTKKMLLVFIVNSGKTDFAVHLKKINVQHTQRIYLRSLKETGRTISSWRNWTTVCPACTQVSMTWENQSNKPSTVRLYCLLNISDCKMLINPCLTFDAIRMNNAFWSSAVLIFSFLTKSWRLILSSSSKYLTLSLSTWVVTWKQTMKININLVRKIKYEIQTPIISASLKNEGSS